MAIVFVTKIENGEKKSEGLCIQCARELGLPIENMLGDIYNKMGISPEQVESMEDDEGVKGGMYSWHQTQQYARNMGITGEERLVEFYAAMNAMYSDFHKAAKKFGVDKPEFYATMAKCFIEDPDAVEDKVAKYYECIARK